ncbi:hypothetical protein DY000_02008019 [Brassica cretica]|uniref:Uncharacterized protein n=1 Tax=Brassica cretica TaxID=69181 RepID=A0ABQ7CJB0_BRACR|nr:hypothetical protein DY000_02008019 [Brassica cretica]
MTSLLHLAIIQQQMQTQQQQMLQMQQTIQNQQQAAQEAAENAAREERGDDQQEVSYVNGQGWQLKNYHPNPNVRNSPQLFWPKQDKPADPAQSNRESELPPADTPAAEKETEPTVGTNSPGPEQPAEAVRPIPEPVPAREYTPKLPYPVPAKATRKDREEMKYRKMLKELTVRLPLMDAIQMMPSMRNFMKGLISGKISEESELMTVSKECIAVLQNMQIKKRGDPIPTEDPLELTLVRAEAEQSVENIDADGYAKMLDSARSLLSRLVPSESLGLKTNQQREQVQDSGLF